MKKVIYYLKNPEKFLKDPKTSLIFGGITFTIILIIIFIAGYHYGQQSLTNKNISLEPQVLGLITSAKGEPKEFEHDKIYSRSGKVVKIESNKIFFESIYSLNYRLIKANLSATIGPETKILKRDIYKIYLAGPNTKKMTGAEVISLKDVKIGDKVQVSAKENIKHKRDFLADKIEVQYKSKEF